MSNSPSPSPPSSHFPWPAVFLTALAPAMLLLAMHAPRTLERAGRAMAFAWQLDGEEGFLLNQALQLSRGRGIYPPIADEPHVVGNYPPVYPALWAALELLSGRPASLALGRLICLAAFAVIVAIAALMTWRGTGRHAIAPLAPLLFIVTYDWFDWIAYARVDIPAMTFSMGALACVALAPPERLARRAAWAAGLALLALWTKQTMLAAPLAIAVWLGLARRDGRALRQFALWLLAPGAVIFLALMLLTRGELFRHLITYNANTFEWFQVTAGLKHLKFFQLWAIMALAAGAAGWAALWWLRRNAESESNAESTQHGSGRAAPHYLALCALYALFAAGNLWAIGKEGSATNYLLEVHLSLALLVTALIGALLQAFDRPAPPAREALGARLTLGAIIALLTIHPLALLLPLAPPPAPGGKPLTKAALMFSRPTPTPGDAQAERDIESAFAEAIALAGPDAVLAEYPIYGLHQGARPVIQPFIMSQLAREGKWNAAPLLADIRGGRFRWLLLTQELERDQAFFRWSPEFVAAFRDAFTPRGKYMRLGGREQMILYEFSGPRK